MTLADWLERIQQMHPEEIELGLDRVAKVASALGLGKPARRVITVTGTNGKGSVVGFIDSIARAAGYKVGKYTSPHLLEYNERVAIAGEPVGDEELVAAFEAVEAARGEVPLTYFEFGTLAALWLFARADLDLAVLEVGMGGRLDAVNIVDADVAVVTTVALDHVEYLGRDREAIGREKAGILRVGKPCVVGDAAPPQSLLQHAAKLGTPLLQLGRDFRFAVKPDRSWSWDSGAQHFDLPAPGLLAPAQHGNAAMAIAALRAVLPPLPIDADAIARGVSDISLPARMQVIPGPVEIILDVAHNPQAAQQLAQWLTRNRARGATQAVFAALADKDVANEVAAMMNLIDVWRLAGLPNMGKRGQSVEALWQQVAGLLQRSIVTRHTSVARALLEARQYAQPGDRIVVFGSFHTVAEAFTELQKPQT
jgi:dihydrofolate synthase/folylpolyglutamate synthase